MKTSHLPVQPENTVVQAASLPMSGIPVTGATEARIAATLAASRMPVSRLQGARGRWQAYLGLTLAWAAAAGLLFASLRSIPLVEIGRVLARLGAGQALALAAVNLLILALMTVRWALLLRSLGRPVGLRALLGIRLAGFGVSYFTPGPQFGGEPVQVDLLRRRGVPLPDAISSVFLDRLVDLLANFTFLVVGLLTLSGSGVLAGNTASPGAGLGGFALLALPLAHLAALWSGRQPAAGLLDRLAGRVSWRWLARVQSLVHQSEAQISWLCRTQPAVLLQVLALSGAIWLIVIFEFALTLRYLGVEASLVQVIIALTAARLAFLMPLPGGIGVLEASQVFITQVLGWGMPVGIALSLIIRARDVLLASLGMWLGGLAYRKTLVKPWVSEERS